MSIKDTVGSIWVVCPKCKHHVIVTEWGKQKCRYEKCDGHEFVVEYNLETATEMLKEVLNEKKREVKRKIVGWIPPKLQRTNAGWIMVQQFDYAAYD